MSIICSRPVVVLVVIFAVHVQVVGAFVAGYCRVRSIRELRDRQLLVYARVVR